jgi:hypothetical protein
LKTPGDFCGLLERISLLKYYFETSQEIPDTPKGPTKCSHGFYCKNVIAFEILRQGGFYTSETECEIDYFTGCNFFHPSECFNDISDQIGELFEKNPSEFKEFVKIITEAKVEPFGKGNFRGILSGVRSRYDKKRTVEYEKIDLKKAFPSYFETKAATETEQKPAEKKLIFAATVYSQKPSGKRTSKSYATAAYGNASATGATAGSGAATTSSSSSSSRNTVPISKAFASSKPPAYVDVPQPKNDELTVLEREADEMKKKIDQMKLEIQKRGEIIKMKKIINMQKKELEEISKQKKELDEIDITLTDDSIVQASANASSSEENPSLNENSSSNETPSSNEVSTSVTRYNFSKKN